MNDDLRQQLFLIADEMRGIATLADRFGDSYAKERAHNLMRLAAKLAALPAPDDEAAAITELFDKRPWLRFSPAIGVDAAVFNVKREILLIQRRDNATWAMPGGLAEIGQTLAEACVRELWEEAGLRGRVIRPLGVFDGPQWGSYARVHLINMVFLVQCDDLNPSPGLEALDAGFFAQDALPDNMNRNHAGRVPKTFDMLASGCHLDLADAATMELTDFQRPVGD